MLVRTFLFLIRGSGRKPPEEANVDFSSSRFSQRLLVLKNLCLHSHNRTSLSPQACTPCKLCTAIFLKPLCPKVTHWSAVPSAISDPHCAYYSNAHTHTCPHPQKLLCPCQGTLHSPAASASRRSFACTSGRPSCRQVCAHIPGHR